MDWTSKTSFQWDWESLPPFSGKESELSRIAHVSDWKVECALEINNGSLYPSGNGAFAVSEMGSLSNGSSVSASGDSLTKVGKQRSQLNLEVKTKMDAAGTSPLLVPNNPKEHLIRLKFGKRTYFEDVSSFSMTANPSSSRNASNTLVKKLKVYPHGTQNYYCQVEGCNLDLSMAKDYHRKHRVCESHSKAPKVVVDGQERRFCQQCSRFHALSEFDEKKRSCRRRLSDHNARRRKPPPDIISFSSSILPSYDNKRQVNLVFGHDPFNHASVTAGSTWNDSGSFKLTQLKGSCIKRGSDTKLQFPTIGLSNRLSAVHQDLDRLLPYKGTTVEILNQGIEASVDARSLDGGPFRHARSLLSTDPWGSASLGATSNTQFVNTNGTASSRPVIQAFAATEFWRSEQSQWNNAGQFHE